VPEAPKPEETPALPPEPELSALEQILARMAACLGVRDYEGALALFDEIEPEEAAKTGLRLVKASILSSAGRLDEARSLVETIIREEPENIEALFVLAAVESASGKEREQRSLLERILRLDGAHVQALNSLGNINLRNQSYRTAASFFDRALAADPEDVDALLGRGEVYRREGKFADAEGLLNKAVDRYPQRAAVWSGRARLYREAGYPNKALEDLDKARELAPEDYWVAYDRGNALLALNRKEDALGEFTRAIALDPDRFMTYAYSAGIKDELGDYDGAEQDYLTLARLKPEYYFAFEGLGIHKMRRGQWLEARDAFQEAYRFAPQEWSYALLAAMNWMKGGRPSDPRQFLEQALRKVQRETLEWYLLRLYHDLSGDNDAAIRIDRERDLDKKARLLYYLAEYYNVRGNTSLAARYFLQVRELNQRYMIEWRLNEWALERMNAAPSRR
jgi:tetratricopeptide (TPR) repeat protein